MSLTENIPDKLKPLLDLPVAVFGFGAGGQAVIAYLEKLGARYVCYDQGMESTDFRRASFTSGDAANHRLVIYSPAFPKDHPWFQVAHEANLHHLSELAFAMQVRDAPLIAVIGTNGKTTLTEFACFALKRTGRNAIAVGENHYPMSRLAVHPDQNGVIAVCEIGVLTASRLEYFHADTLFWTNFHEDFQDYFTTPREQFMASFRLLEKAPGVKLYAGTTVAQAAREFGVELPENSRIVNTETLEDWDLAEPSAFATSIHHQTLNLFRLFWEDLGLSEINLKSAAENFVVRAHRLHRCGLIRGITYWNDSKASNYAATKMALAYFNKPVVWIGGGHWRGSDLTKFVQGLREHIKFAVPYGETGKYLHEIFEKEGVFSSHHDSVLNAVESAHDLSEDGDHIVFSPGFPPEANFRDFIERGICYENAVLGLKHRYGGT